MEHASSESVPWAGEPVPTYPAAATRVDSAGDVLRVEAEPAEAKLDREATVEADGNLALGVRFGRVDVAGKTLTEAEKAIQAVVAETFRDPQVQVTFTQQAPFDKQTISAASPDKLKQLEMLVKHNYATRTELSADQLRHNIEVRALEAEIKALKTMIQKLKGDKRRSDFDPPLPTRSKLEPTTPSKR